MRNSRLVCLSGGHNENTSRDARRRHFVWRQLTGFSSTTQAFVREYRLLGDERADERADALRPDLVEQVHGPFVESDQNYNYRTHRRSVWTLLLSMGSARRRPRSSGSGPPVIACSRATLSSNCERNWRRVQPISAIQFV